LGAYAPANDGGGAVFLGDSITASGDNLGNDNLTWSALLPALTFQRLRRTAIKGVPGNTTAQMLARLSADVIAYKPRYCVVLGGANDGVFATAVSGLTAIYNALDAAGIQAIACTIPPNNTTPAYPQQLNPWIAETAMRRGYPLLDHFSVLVDPTTGHYQAALTADGTHPTAQGHRLMAAAAATTLNPYLPARQQQLTGSDADTTSLLWSGCFTKPRIFGDGFTTDPTNGYGWVSSLGANSTISRTATGTGVPIIGQWSQIVTTAGGGSSTVQSFQDQGPTYITTGFSVGDKLLLSARVQSTGCEAGGMCPSIGVVAVADGTTILTQGISSNGVATDVTDGLFFYTMVVPATTTKLQVNYGLYPVVGGPGTGSGTARFGQIGLYNLTALGLA
jgi:lysophospholipase L1-like esterase